MTDFTFFILQGFYHVLDYAAIDHILFFIALTIVYNFKNWKKALLLITFFTIGHSFTFALSAYNIIDINVDLVEFLIPVTILITLLLNIYTSLKNNNKLNNTNIYFALGFGFIHGLGFSNYFKILLDKTDDKLIPLLKFALGIEFAQIIIVLLVLLLSHFAIRFFKIKKKYWVITISIFVILKILPMLYYRYPF